MQDLIIVAIIVLIVGFATWYVIKAKKSGRKCIGCPDGCSCCKSTADSDCSCGCSDSK